MRVNTGGWWPAHPGGFLFQGTVEVVQATVDLWSEATDNNWPNGHEQIVTAMAQAAIEGTAAGSIDK